MLDDSAAYEYVHALTHQDRLRVEYSHRRGVVVSVMVQLECLIGGTWRPARRYDTHLGLHIHTAPWGPETDRKIPMGYIGLSDALNLAIDDIKRNWERYRAACAGA